MRLNPFLGQYHPDTTTERVASHIPGTDAHAERSELTSRTEPGSHMKANVPATAEYERKREIQREMGTGLSNPATDVGDVYGSTGRGGLGNTQPGAHYDTLTGTHGASTAEPVGTTGRHTAAVPSTGAVEGTAPFRNEHGTTTEKRVSIGDKVIGATERTLGKVMNKPAMVEKGIERQVSPAHMP